jgi:hypothetical protein
VSGRPAGPQTDFTIRLPWRVIISAMSQPLVPRRAQRRPVRLAATCRTQNGLRDNGHISDISAHGCCLTTNTLSVRIGARVVIKPDGLEGMTGIVRWIDGQNAGIEFETPLYEPVVDHLSRMHGAGQPVGVSSW